MTELLWQTVFSLVGAFFLGAVLACSLKRRFYYGPPQKKAPAEVTGAPPTPNASQPKIEVGARDGERFERALAGTAAPAPRASAAPVTPAAVPAAAKPAAPAAQPPAAPQPEAPQGIPRVSVSRGSGAPMRVDEGGAGPSDDLTRIRGIDSIMQGRLKELGLRRYQDLAGLTPADIRGLAATLGLKDRIGEENWVGQAQILATGQATHFSRRNDEGIPIPANVEPSAPAPAAAAVPPTFVAPSRPAHAANDGSPPADVAYLRSVRSEALLGDLARRRSNDVDDLKRIRGIGVLIEKKLNSLGILSYEQVANWTGADIERISRILDFKGRIEREHWIEQARILATGGQTEFSRRGER
jgi:predicted flap endonuclease-1-like 5' DNA nuclease